MFTGIIKEIGTVRSIKKQNQVIRIEIEAEQSIQDALIGDSIAVNGCCLTIVELSSQLFAAEIVEETLNITCLGELQQKHPVNLEPALRMVDRLGGHFVQGHVDGVGVIRNKIKNSDNSFTIEISVPNHLLKYIVKKGSIAVDGVSLTVAELTDSSFFFAMIPHTTEKTNLGWKQIGKSVNLEVDIIAKYTYSMVNRSHG